MLTLMQMTMGLKLKRETRKSYIQLQRGKCLSFIEMMLSIIRISE